MFLFADFHTDDALKDDSVGISIQNLISRNAQDAICYSYRSGKQSRMPLPP